MSEYKLLIDQNGRLEFNAEAITEYILDENMSLKAVRFRNGEVHDIHHLHTRHKPKHPLLKTPEMLGQALDTFFLNSLAEKRMRA